MIDWLIDTVVGIELYMWLHTLHINGTKLETNAVYGNVVNYCSGFIYIYDMQNEKQMFIPCVKGTRSKCSYHVLEERKANVHTMCWRNENQMFIPCVRGTRSKCSYRVLEEREANVHTMCWRNENQMFIPCVRGTRSKCSYHLLVEREPNVHTMC